MFLVSGNEAADESALKGSALIEELQYSGINMPIGKYAKGNKNQIWSN